MQGRRCLIITGAEQETEDLELKLLKDPAVARLRGCSLATWALTRRQRACGGPQPARGCHGFRLQELVESGERWVRRSSSLKGSRLAGSEDE